MKRMFILLIAVLLLCGCTEGEVVPNQTAPTIPTETTVPETTLPPETTQATVPQITEPSCANAGIIERMGSLKESHVYSFSAPWDGAELAQVVKAINAAAECSVDWEGSLMSFYSMDLYLNEALTTGQECLLLYAGLEENIVEVLYRNREGDSERRFFEAPDLYWLIRNCYRPETAVDEDAYSRYREQLDSVAQAIVDETLGMNGEKAYTGFRVVELQQVDAFDNYTVYHWNVAFTTEDIHNVGWAGGMYLDASARVRAVIEETYFVVREDGETRFLFWDLYFGETEAQEQENAHATIQRAFAE